KPRKSSKISPPLENLTKLSSQLVSNGGIHDQSSCHVGNNLVSCSDIGRIRVMGYSTELPGDDVESSLRKHFSSCGEITDVCVLVLDNNILNSFGFIYFLGGQGTVDKAMQLSGTDVGGWNVIVEPYPFGEDADWDPIAIVQGYDTCLGKTDIKRMLFDHFSSCGQIKDIKFHKSSIGVASVSLYGEGAEDKVSHWLILFGRDLQLEDLQITNWKTCLDLGLSQAFNVIFSQKHKQEFWGFGKQLVFNSCAEVTEIRVHKRSIGAAVVELYGEDAEQKVMDLDGSIMGMSQLTLNESETKKTRPRKRDIGRIRVRGYNTDLPHDDVVSALRKHFSSCGEITDVYIFEKTDGLHSFGFIYFLGEGAVDKALQLSGIDVGGWTVIAEPYPFTEHAGCYPAVVVQGYDTLLDNADIEKMLFEHFSSCAEVTEIRVHKRSIGAAVVELYGEDAEQKVMDLDGSIMVGCKISVTLYTAPTVYSVHPRRRRNRNYYPVALCFDS
ncbi:unnamed protein product, partial [Brassica oleracea var. botrytis]